MEAVVVQNRHWESHVYLSDPENYVNDTNLGHYGYFINSISPSSHVDSGGLWI